MVRLALLLFPGIFLAMPVTAQSLGQALGISPVVPATTTARNAESASLPRAPAKYAHRRKHTTVHVATKPGAGASAANEGTIGVMSEGASEHYMRMTADLTATFDKRPDLRVIGIIGKGTEQNIRDLAYRRGVDVALTHSNALDIARKLGDMPNVENTITYIARLQNEEMHVLTSNDVTDIHQLAGKKVNVRWRAVVWLLPAPTSSNISASTSN